MPRTMRPRLFVEIVDDVAVVVLGDRVIGDSGVVDEIRDGLKQLNAMGYDRIILNFVNVQLLASELLCVLLGVQRRVEARGGKLVLCGLRPTPRECLRITALDHFFSICEDEGDAFDAFV